MNTMPIGISRLKPLCAWSAYLLPSIFCLALAGITSGVAHAQSMSYTLGTSALLEGSAAGTDSVILAVSPQGGPWAAAANAAWLHLSNANQNGYGSTDVIFTFDANTNATRSGT